jgi:hypothetical protein
MCVHSSLSLPPHPQDIRERTDALDAAGNTTAAIGKGFAIGSGEPSNLAIFSCLRWPAAAMVGGRLLCPHLTHSLPNPHCAHSLFLPCPAAALVSLALFGAYVTRAGITLKDSSILDPEVSGNQSVCCSDWVVFHSIVPLMDCERTC